MVYYCKYFNIFSGQIKIMTALLSPVGVAKHLKYILSTEIVLEYNVDGTHGKKSLKQLKMFYTTLIGNNITINKNKNSNNNNNNNKYVSYFIVTESITLTNLGPPELQLRKAFQLQKKRHFKQISLNK